MSNINEEVIAAKLALLVAERQKVEAETAEIAHRIKTSRVSEWAVWTGKGVIAGFLIWAFSLDHIVKLYSIQASSRGAAERAVQDAETKLAAVTKSKAEAVARADRAVAESKRIQAEVNEATRVSRKLTAENKELRKFKNALSLQIAATGHGAPGFGGPLPPGFGDRPAILPNVSTDPDTKVQEGSNTWFTVVGSATSLNMAKRALPTFRSKASFYGIAVFETSSKSGSRIYAFTLGAGTTRQEAIRRMDFAKANFKYRPYVWNTNLWKSDVSASLE